MTGRRRSRRVSGPGRRGQSLIDYAIGISLFLVVVFGVLAFLPTVFGAAAGDDPGDPSDRVAADRVATHLTETVFANPSRPNQFSTDCVREYFGSSDPDVSCSYAGPGASIAEAVGLSANRPLNVTLRAEIAAANDGMEMLCWDTSDDTLTARATCSSGPAGSDLVFRGGPSPSDNDDFETARRFGRLAGEDVHIIVRTW